MSNPFLPNTASIPNIIFDYWMSKLSPAEFKVLMCISRKTYGFNKNVDRISVSQIEKMTALSRFGIHKCLATLTKLGLIVKVKSKTAIGDDDVNQYEINLNCVTPGVESLAVGGGQLSLLGVVNSVDKGVVNSVDPQNPTYTKPNIQNITPTPKTQEPPIGGVCGNSFSSSKKSSKKVKEPDTPKDLYLDHVLLTKDEHAKLLELHGEKELLYVMEILNAFIGSTGKVYKSHYFVLGKGGWAYKRLQEDKAKNPNLKPSDSTYKRYGKMAIEADKRAVPTERQILKVEPMTREQQLEALAKFKAKCGQS